MTQKRKLTKIKLILTTLGLMILVLTGILFSFPYLINYLVSPDVLIENTTQALESLTGAEIHIGQAKLSMLDGITFRNVRVQVPESKRKLEPAFTEDDGLLLQADSFHVKLRRKGFFGLDFGIGTVSVEKPEFHLVRMKPADKWNWQMLFAGPATGPAQKHSFGLGPPIILDDGKIVLKEIQGRKRVSLGDVYFSASALPQQQRTFYRIDLKTWTAQGPGPNILIDFNTRTSEILSGSVETIAMSNIEQTLPEPVRGWLQKLYLAGKVAISEIRYKPDATRRIVLTLDNVSTKIPTSVLEYQSDSPRALFNLTELKGQIIIDGNEVSIPELRGKLNGAPCTISGKMPQGLSDPEKSPFDLRIACQGFTCPEYTDPKVQDYMDTMIPWSIRSFFHDFKPIGLVDVDLSVSQPSDMNREAVLSGKIIPQRCSAEYYKFPYRVKNITGTVEIDHGRFQLNKLTCSTDSGWVTVSGSVSEASQNAEVALTIDSKRTAFDSKLRNALSGEYQSIFDQFKPTGYADTHIELYNPPGGNKPWTTVVAARLIDVSAVYENFRYPANSISGQLKFRNNRLDLENISGRHGDAEFTLSGVVENFQALHPAVKIDLSANHVSIDQTLIDSLPSETQQFVRDCRLTGKTNIKGSLTKGSGQPYDYSFRCQLDGAGLQPKEFPYPLENLSGELTLSPKDVTIGKMISRNGRQTISVSGQVHSDGQQCDLGLTIDAEQLTLNDSLRLALPKAAGDVWTLFNPSGTIDAHAEIRHVANTPWNWSIDVKLRDAVIRYKNLSPITGLFGRVVFTPGKTELCNITGLTDEKSAIKFAGTIDTTSSSTVMTIPRLEIDRIGVSEGFLSTLIGQKVVDSFKWTPGGTARCHFKNLLIEMKPDSSQQWSFAGDFSFHDVKMAVFGNSPTTMNYTGSFTWQSKDANFGLDGKIDLTTLNWDDRKLENIHSTLKKELSSETLNIEGLRGRYAGGQISGIARMNFLEKETRYGLQLTLDNLDAATVMNLKKGKSEIQGKMKGEIYMVGTLGQKYSQIGGGLLQITGAEVLKVPLMARIYEEVNKDTPNLTSFHDITMQYALEQYQVGIEHLELIGPTLSLVGSGDYNISNKRINLDLISGTPKSLNKVPLLPELMQGASREISQIEVHGTLDNPQIKVQPMKDISDTLKTFFNGKTVR